jgi:hypothetical protein
LQNAGFAETDRDGVAIVGRDGIYQMLSDGGGDPTFGDAGLANVGGIGPAVRTGAGLVLVGDPFVRLLPNGALDPSFHGEKFEICPFHEGWSDFVAMSDGRLLAFLSTSVECGARYFLMKRYLPNGPLDTQFFTVNVPSFGGGSVALQGDGHILIAVDTRVLRVCL